MRLITIQFSRSLISLFVLLVFATAAFAQSNTGSITGVVSDQNGAVVPNATVTVTNQGTNEKRTAQTDGEGRYEVPALPNGIYTVEAAATGFKTTSVKDLRLAVGEKARSDLAMNVSGVDCQSCVGGLGVVPRTSTAINFSINVFFVTRACPLC